MAFDLDTAILIVFLSLNLGIGILFSKGAKDAKEYAIGTRSFATGAITTTIIATCIGAGFFSASISESYRQGLYFIIPALGEPLALIITGYFLVPRMVEFFGNMSVAETMGKIYGKNVRLISAIAGMLIATGIVALQFKVASSIMQLFFGISSVYAVALSATVVIAYSSFGGIKAVTYTDIIQFLTFGVILPIITMAIWKPSFGDASQILQKISQAPIFDIHEVFDVNNPRFLSSLALLLFFLIPNCDVTYIQRIGMAKNVEQARKSFIIAGCIVTVMLLIACWTGALLFSSDPTIEPGNILTHIIESYTYVGLKGLTAVCIMAVIMSTADSYLNSASILLTHDIIKPLRPNFTSENKELMLLRIVSLCIGIIAFFVACKASSLFNLLLLTFGFYMPVVTVPLMLAIFGFRTSSKVVIIGMAAGIITLILWSMDSANAAVWSRFISNVEAAKVTKKMFVEINPVIPAMLANLITVIIAHFIFGRPKGNFSAEYSYAVAELAKNRHQKILYIFHSIKSFSFIDFCKKHKPQYNSLYMLLGLFSLASTFFTMYTASETMQTNYSSLLRIIYHTTLVVSFVLLTHPVWSLKVKGETFMAIFWMFAVPYILIFSPLLLVIMSGLGETELIVFLISTIVLALLVKWQLYLAMLVTTMVIGVEFFKWFTQASHILIDYMGIEFKIACIILLVSSTIIAFLKPKQELQELSEEKIDHLEYKVSDYRDELYKALELKYEFLRNLQHEARTPITGITSMAQVIDETYDSLPEEKRRKVIHDIALSAERLESYVNNLIDVSKLVSMKYELHKDSVNISKLIAKKLEKVSKLYIPQDKKTDRDFILNIESPDITIACDEYYMGRSIENILINAIQYCTKGEIEITLKKTDQGVEFSVKDRGIGIPQEDLKDIFGAFTTSAKTKTPAGGRGVGLALAKAVIDLHGGTVTAESDGLSWTRVGFVL